jgi:uncharacterized protein YjiK
LEIKLKSILFCLLLVSSLGACLKDEPVTGGATTAEGEYPTGLEGLSAICLNEAGDGLYVAEDNGHVYEFDLEGKLKNTFSFPAPDNAHDWEGITRASDGSIYLCEERAREVYKLSADHKSVTLIYKGKKESGGKDNQGFEGIAAGPDGILYVANQSLPKRVYTYNLGSKAWATAFDADWAESLSDIYYDNGDGTLWITDAKTQILTQVKTDGTVLKNISISFVKKPEGYCKDTAHNAYWFVCDETAKLQKVSKLE